MCVWLVLVAIVCVGLMCFAVSVVLVRKFLVLDLVLLWCGLTPNEFTGNFCFNSPLTHVCVVCVGCLCVCVYDG